MFSEHLNNQFLSLGAKLVNNHIMIDDGQGLILDTGSPASFHKSGKITIGEDEIPVPDSLPEISSDILSEMVGADVCGLLGLDLINRYSMHVSLKNNFLFLNDDARYSKHLLPIQLPANMLGVRVMVNGRPAKMVVDSAAPISYIDTQYLQGCKCVGQEKDFSPYCGQFETTIYEAETDLLVEGGRYMQTYGTPAPIVSQMLKMLGVDGILGVELFKKYRLQLRDNLIYFPQQGI